MRIVDFMRRRKLEMALWAMLVLSAVGLWSAPGPGLPEPGLVLYGVIRNLDGRDDVRMTVGALRCEVTPSSGPGIVLVTNLQNINDQFSYVLLVPFETEIGAGVSSNALVLNSAGSSYTVRFYAENVLARRTTTNSFTFSAADRGRQQRIDLDVSIAAPDANHNGLPDWWEQRYFGGNADLSGDPDHDGMTNLQEYRAGTNPTNAASVFAFINVTRDEQPGALLRWSSITNRTYTVLRSAELMGLYVAVATNLPATPPVNTLRDTNAGGILFYRVAAE